jgi:ABC-2 type transport system permease protein
MRMLLLFLKQRIISLRHAVNGRSFLRRAPFVILGVGFWVLLYLGTYKVLSIIRGIEYIGDALSGRLFALIFFSLTVFLVLSNIITCLQSFYLSGDIPFLLSTPVEMKDILKLKTCESVLNSSWMVISFVTPIFLAYGVNYHVRPIFYAALFLVFSLFVLLNAAAGISIAHVLAGVFPVARSRQLLAAAGVTLFVTLYFLIRSAIPGGLTSPEGVLSSLLRFGAQSPLLPDYWAASALLPLLTHEKPDIFYLEVLFSNSAFFLLLSSLIGERLYRRNLEKIQPSPRRTGAGLLGGFYPRSGAAFFYKDLKTFFRDAGQWSQLLIIAALSAVYFFNFRSIPIDSLSSLSPFMKEILVLANMVMAGLMLSAVAARFLYTSVSLEGRAFWIVRSSPVAIKAFLWSKFLYNCIPLSLLIVLLTFLTNKALHVDGAIMLLSGATSLMLCISVSGLGTGFGAMYPHFRYRNIAAVSMSLGGMAFMLISFGVVIATLFFESAAYYLYRVRPRINGTMNVADMILIAVCILLVPLINAASFYLPMKRGERMLAHRREVS